MADRWYAPHAWLGGPGLAGDVVLEVAHGRITGVERGASPSGATRLDGVLLPGFTTAHSHAFHRVLRGRTHRRAGDFWIWRDLMYTVAQRLEPDAYRRLAGEVFGEMLRAGFTAVGEFHYVHHRQDGTRYQAPHALEHAVLAAAADTGIRLTLLDACYLTATVDGTPPAAHQLRFSDGDVDAWAERVRDLAGSSRLVDTTSIAVAAHSVRAVGAGDLPRVADVAAELGSPLHVHVSEQRAENDGCVAHHGVSPIRLLADAGLMTPRATAVHATHPLDGDLAILAESGTRVCLCPTTERDLGDGMGPAREYRDAGIPLCVGSDSNAVVDPFAEMRAIEMNDRLRFERRGVHDPESLMAMATAEGLASLGWGLHGPLDPDGPADFIAVDPTGPDLAGFDPDDGLGGLVFGASGRAVTDVVVGGRRIVAGGVNVSGHSPARLGAAIMEVWQ